MSKSMAIDGVMKIFLMIAVIIVGMSFLMKAFGIDILEWLKERLGGIGIPETGKALHVKMKTGADEKDVHSFHLLNDREIMKHWTDRDWKPGALTYYDLYFMIETSSSKNKLINGNCLILAGDEFPDKDEAQVYYVKPGTLIQEGCDSLGQCVTASNILDKGCSKRQIVSGGNPKNPRCDVDDGPSNVECHDKFGIVNLARHATSPFQHDYPKCDEGSSKTVLQSFRFSNDVKISDTCAKDNPKECNLLDYEEQKKSAFYGSRVKYGLLCGDDGKWHTCKQQTGSKPITTTVGSISIDCSLSDDVFVWDKSKIDQTIAVQQASLCTHLDNSDCPDNKPIKDICTGECRPSSSCTFQGPCQSNLVMNPCSGQCVRTQ